MSKKQKSILSKEALTFLRKYLNNPSPTGFEKEGQKLWLEYLQPFIDEYYVDAYGSAVGIINPKAPFKVVIEAHADEISWFVNYVSPEGLIYVIRNGGSDQQIAPSKRVNIHTELSIPACAVQKVKILNPRWRTSSWIVAPAAVRKWKTSASM